MEHKKHTAAEVNASTMAAVAGCAADASVEATIERKGLTAPRVTLADLEANIVHIEIVKHVTKAGKVLRWAVITTRNGFAVTGSPSAAVSAANDDAELGELIARKNAMDALWPMMGYALAEHLANVDKVRIAVDAFNTATAGLVVPIDFENGDDRTHVEHDRASDDGMPPRQLGL